VQPGRLLSVVFVVALAAGFGVGRAVVAGDGGAPAPTGGAAERAEVAEDAPAATTTEAPARPTRVLLAGDSVMAGLVPAVEAALEPAGGAEVSYVLTPSILREPSVRFSWSQELEELDPDVVVMFVGTWEARDLPEAGGTGTTVQPGQSAWPATYRAEVVDPWLELITSHGAEVVWIGAPPIADPEGSGFFELLNGVFAALPADWPQVDYLDPAPALGAPGRGFSETVTLADGTSVRLRQVDGLHLCPAGAQLLAELVVDAIAAEPPEDGWQDGDWRADQGLYPTQACPTGA
jgi:hypothetical protein